MLLRRCKLQSWQRMKHVYGIVCADIRNQVGRLEQCNKRHRTLIAKKIRICVRNKLIISYCVFVIHRITDTFLCICYDTWISYSVCYFFVVKEKCYFFVFVYHVIISFRSISLLKLSGFCVTCSKRRVQIELSSDKQKRVFRILIYAEVEGKQHARLLKNHTINISPCLRNNTNTSQALLAYFQC